MASRIGSLMRLRDLWLQGFTPSVGPDLQMRQATNPSSLQTICCRNVYLIRTLTERSDALGFIAASCEGSIAFWNEPKPHQIPATLPKLRRIPVARAKLVRYTPVASHGYEKSKSGDFLPQM